MMTYRVMVACPSGTIRLVDDSAGVRWESVRTTITWCNESTRDAAQATANALMDGNPRVRAWVEDDLTTRPHL